MKDYRYYDIKVDYAKDALKKQINNYIKLGRNEI